MEIKYKKNHARQVITYCYSNFMGVLLKLYVINLFQLSWDL